MAKIGSRTEKEWIQWLTQQAKEMAQQYWKMEFKIPIEINPKLKTTLGRYHFAYLGRDTKYGFPVKIDISKKMLEQETEEVILDVLKHELCHWFLSVTGKPFSDGDKEFKKELKRIEASRTGKFQHEGDYRGKKKI